MLTTRQIKKMAKPYSNSQMTNSHQKVRYSAGWWSNGFIAFHEPKPEKVSALEIEVSEEIPAEVASWETGATIQVWPVELRGNVNVETKYKSPTDQVVKFSDGNGTVQWYDARYISAILRRAPDVEFYINPGSNFLAARNGKPVACLAPRHSSVSRIPFDWSLSNDSLASATFLSLARCVIAQKPKGTGRKVYSAIALNGETVKARTTKSGVVIECNGNSVHVKFNGELTRVKV